MSLTDEEAEPADFRGIVENDFQQIKNKVTKMGYADGVTNGRDSVFQQGFDQGYKDGLRTSFEIGKYRHFFANVNMDKVEGKQEMQKEKEKFDNLKLTESKSSDHFQFVCYKKENLDFISQKQHEYVDEIVGRLAQTIPQASNLLKPQLSINFM